MKASTSRPSSARCFVSVPLRGVGVERWLFYRPLRRKILLFPSPCGELELKVLLDVGGILLVGIVSVPLRGVGVESRQYVTPEGENYINTVSVPLRGVGVESRKYSQIPSILANVSVPLRGVGVERVRRRPYSQIRLHDVSVPLRGVGVERLPADTQVTLGDFLFPSPCGELELKGFFPEVDTCDTKVSVPLRGVGVERKTER